VGSSTSHKPIGFTSTCFLFSFSFFSANGRRSNVRLCSAHRFALDTRRRASSKIRVSTAIPPFLAAMSLVFIAVICLLQSPEGRQTKAHKKGAGGLHRLFYHHDKSLSDGCTSSPALSATARASDSEPANGLSSAVACKLLVATVVKSSPVLHLIPGCLSNQRKLHLSTSTSIYTSLRLVRLKTAHVQARHSGILENIGSYLPNWTTHL
jgi:hypothetical protein